MNVSVAIGNNQYLSWGEDTIANEVHVYLHEENAGLIVGNECLFSAGIVIWATDGHSIINESDGKVINLVQNPVIIGDRCWIGYGVCLLKNAKLANDTIVGSCSVVTRAFDESNVVIAGNPAKIVKKNVLWNRKTPYSYIHK